MSIEVIENCLGESIKSSNHLRKILSGLDYNKLMDLHEAYCYYFNHWIPESEFGHETIHLGRCSFSLSNPLLWVPWMASKARFSQLNSDQIHRLLLYIPKVSVWIPPLRTPDLFKDEFEDFLTKLVELRHFISDGSVLLVPDKYYEDVCQWGEPRAKPSEMLLLARQEALDIELREILDQIDFFPFDGIDDAPCSDSHHIHALNNAEAIKYINPLNELNEDFVIQTLLKYSTLCTSQTMFELLTKKFDKESIKTGESTWSNISASLPKIHNIPIKDLRSIRNNEESFSIWRNSLSQVVRSWENELAKGEGLDAKEALRIFQEITHPIQMTIENRIQSKTIKSALESSAVSFASGAIAASYVGNNPANSILTGGIASLLKISFDLIKTQKTKKIKPLMRMYSVFNNLN